MVFEKIKFIISEQFHISDDEIELETNFRDDLDADSVDLVELIMELEDEFGTEVDDNEIEDIETVGDAVEYIESALGENI